jgi:hypothetical protein
MMELKKWLEQKIYITEEKFDLPDYRTPIVWFDKMLVAGGILISIVGRILSLIWILLFVQNDMQSIGQWKILVVGVLLWACGEYFLRTGNRGLIYFHMDFLVEYLEKRLTKKDNDEL